MKLSAPKFIIWLLALILAGLAIASNYVGIPVVGSFVHEVWYQDVLTSQIFTTGIPEFKNGGWEATFKRWPRASVKPYVMGTPA